MKRNIKKSDILLLALALILVLLTGCQKALTPKETYMKLNETNASIQHIQTTFEGSMGMKIDSDDLAVQQMLSMFENMTFTGQLDMAKTDKLGHMATQVKVDMNGLAMTIEAYFDGDNLYFTYPMSPGYMVVNMNDLVDMVNKSGELPFTLSYDEMITDLNTIISSMIADYSTRSHEFLTEDDFELIEAYDFTIGGETVTSKALKVKYSDTMMQSASDLVMASLTENRDLYDVLKKYDTENALGTFEDYQKQVKDFMEQEGADLMDNQATYKNYDYILGFDKDYQVTYTDILMDIEQEVEGQLVDLNFKLTMAMTYDPKPVNLPELTDTNSMNLLDMIPTGFEYDMSGDESMDMGDQVINDQLMDQIMYLEEMAIEVESAETEEEIMAILEAYLNHEDLNVMYAYLGTQEGKMLLAPATELPEDYDPTIRPWYTDAVEYGYNITDLYEDAATGGMVQTIAMAIYKGEEVYGVVAIDFLTEE